eukprot:CAMPEP_0196761734 /NCGR_PEP_ID=MMETSP1095-20130614/1042_1 /TAXON_ID=96789 ORGANISM="Chromulina nebulosa, Strain UTEXLB2642" /NCGR_SAMPLE_ID=MMETSP1095 /ASSEMBLY_ACC=CAM_ASM_000446 /LENGTH=78 /DNA_ID=CAMNT_0042111653 /DNA_START=278 /DNA_END=514 /DNA_ORIENTATION=-
MGCSNSKSTTESKPIDVNEPANQIDGEQILKTEEPNNDAIVAANAEVVSDNQSHTVDQADVIISPVETVAQTEEVVSQ